MVRRHWAGPTPAAALYQGGDPSPWSLGRRNRDRATEQSPSKTTLRHALEYASPSGKIPSTVVTYISPKYSIGTFLTSQFLRLETTNFMAASA